LLKTAQALFLSGFACLLRRWSNLGQLVVRGNPFPTGAFMSSNKYGAMEVLRWFLRCFEILNTTAHFLNTVPILVLGIDQDGTVSN
jgi:hypothetical protein